MTIPKRHSNKLHTKNRRSAGLIILTTMLLAACGGGGSTTDDNGHADADIDTAGRLAIYNQDDHAISMMNLDTGDITQSFTLTATDTPRLYPSPNSRYAVVVQRSDNLVSFTDSGLYTEDHGDHLHDYAEDPAMVDYTLDASRPTHYNSHENNAVIFFDGESGVASSVMVVSDNSIGAGNLVGELTLTNNMHGAAKLIDDQLFVTYRDPSITDTTLPAAVERYRFANGNFTFENRYTEACPHLHGSAATEAWVTFGCNDGVLAIDLAQANSPATKLDNPTSLIEGNRIGTIASHHAVDQFVGIAGNQLFVIDMANTFQPYQELTLATGVSRITQGFNSEGTLFYVLGDDGILYLYDITSNWSALTPVMVADRVEEESINPVVATSDINNRLFVLNTNGQQIIEVDSSNGAIIRTIDLAFTASRLVWLGLSETHNH